MADDRIGLDDVGSVPDMGIQNVVELPDRYQHTDMGNADRFAERYGQNVRYVAPWSKWLFWDGRRWVKDDVVQVEAWADQTVRAIQEAAKKLPNGTDGKAELVKHAIRSQGANRMRAILELARSRDGIPVRPTELDDGHYLLNVLNGTLDMEAMTLREHNRLDLLTKLAPVTYDPDAECFKWEKFVSEIFCGDEALIDYVQRAAGYSLTGDVSAQVFFLLHGSGENGKTTFLETMRALMGEENAGGYAQQAAPDTFIDSRYGGIPNDVARLMGARFVTAVETGEARKLDETLVKRITGGDAITARFLRAEFFEFEPTFKVWLATNHKPNIKGTDHAIWRRIRLIPFNATFSFENGTRNPNLGLELKRELPGILNWALKGLADVILGNTLDKAPATVIEATEKYRSEEDVLGRFLEEKCRVEPSGRARAPELYEAYVTWCQESGERAETKNKLGRMLQERGFDSISSNGHNWRLGLELLGPLETDA